MTNMVKLQSHTHPCNTYCRGDVHCDLAYVTNWQDNELISTSIKRIYQEMYPVQVITTAPAHEAPPMEEMHWDHTHTMNGKAHATDVPWLVWWRLSPPAEVAE